MSDDEYNWSREKWSDSNTTGSKEVVKTKPKDRKKKGGTKAKKRVAEPDERSRSDGDSYPVPVKKKSKVQSQGRDEQAERRKGKKRKVPQEYEINSNDGDVYPSPAKKRKSPAEKQRSKLHPLGDDLYMTMHRKKDEDVEPYVDIRRYMHTKRGDLKGAPEGVQFTLYQVVRLQKLMTKVLNQMRRKKIK